MRVVLGGGDGQVAGACQLVLKNGVKETMLSWNAIILHFHQLLAWRL